MSGIFVAVEGPTGVGKTTLAAKLAERLEAIAKFDPFEDNPFLAPFLVSEPSDEPQALEVELTFLALRVSQLRRIARLLASGCSVVADWTLSKQEIFAATTLGPEDVARVRATVDVWADTAPAPDLLIGLSATTPILRQRVRQRGRDIEASLTDRQLKALGAAFDAAYACWERPLIRLDTSTFNTFDPNHIHDLATRIRRVLLLESR